MEYYNIISNCCVGARFYEELHTEFRNPFMWNVISLSDFIKLVKEWDDINLEKVDYTIVDGSKTEGGRCGCCTLENGVKLKFIHHLYTSNHTVKKVPRVYDRSKYNIMGSDILEYLKGKWIERLKRMGKTKPIFVYFDDSETGNETLDKIITLNTPYKLIVLSPIDYSKYNSNQFHYIVRKNKDTKQGAIDVIDFLKQNPRWFRYQKD